MLQQTKMIVSFHQFLFSLSLCACLLSACSNNNNAQQPTEPVVISKPEQINEDWVEVIRKILEAVAEQKGKLGDGAGLQHVDLLNQIYSANGYQPIWSNGEKWNPAADSLYNFIYFSKYYGLFPTDYSLLFIQRLRTSLMLDSASKLNKGTWAKADMLFSDAYLSIATHLKLGRLPKDSVTLRIDTAYGGTFFLKNLQTAIETKNVRGTLEALEPVHIGYHEIKAALKSFIDSASFRNYTYLNHSYYDTVGFKKQLIKRMVEQGILNKNTDFTDSVAIEGALYKYQKQKGLKANGLVTEATIRSLNSNTDWAKFKRAAINLDRYKQLTDSFPHKYIWVNIPTFSMQLWEGDSLVIQSKVVVGKPVTRTPLLNSKITEMITYPQWTIPNSIIVKEILPGLKKSPDYLQRKGYMLLNSKDEEVDPYYVDWEKYTKGIPYRVVQGSGDDNALGVLKFNFDNKYSVYLHDTNQRYYFKNNYRALSHGCVRVQEWQQLAYYIMRNDSLEHLTATTPFTKDSLDAWLARKEKHIIPVKNSIPLYLRYITCDAKDGKLRFYDDIYAEDRTLMERYFTNKPVY
jgi:murein L,D-transpeptidase YcbB/YkuD